MDPHPTRPRPRDQHGFNGEQRTGCAPCCPASAWRRACPDLAFFEPRWTPAGWDRRRVVVVRRRVRAWRREPFRLDPFEPRERGLDLEFKAVLASKRVLARAVALFHEGRARREARTGDAGDACRFPATALLRDAR